MTRMFDAGQKELDEAAVRARRDEIRRRADEADTAMREAGILDAAASKVNAAFEQTNETVQTIKYEAYRKIGGRISIEHAVAGMDYMFQVFPLRPPTLGEADVLLAMITAMDGIFPRSIQIRYTPPADILPQKFYTVRVQGVAGKPGWQEAVGRALLALSELELWA